jgi:hypothetical protein
MRRGGSQYARPLIADTLKPSSGTEKGFRDLNGKALRRSVIRKLLVAKLTFRFDF